MIPDELGRGLAVQLTAADASVAGYRTIVVQDATATSLPVNPLAGCLGRPGQEPGNPFLLLPVSLSF